VRQSCCWTRHSWVSAAHALRCPWSTLSVTSCDAQQARVRQRFVDLATLASPRSHQTGISQPHWARPGLEEKRSEMSLVRAGSLRAGLLRAGLLRAGR
jgi:hypothetical protein